MPRRALSGPPFFLRQLPVRWNVDAAELDDAGLIRGLAAQLADAISSRLSPGVSTHIAYEDFAVFENEAEWRAGFLASRVRGEDEAWFYASLRSESGTFFQFLERGGVEPILTRLASRDALAAVLRTVSVSDLASILRALGFEPASTDYRIHIVAGNLARTPSSLASRSDARAASADVQ